MKKLSTIFLLILCLSLDAQITDIGLLRSINTPHSLKMDGTFNGISNSVFMISVSTPLVLATIGFVKDDPKYLTNCLLLIASTAVVLGSTDLLKVGIGRKRPFETYPDIYSKTKFSFVMDGSMPSGHTSSAFNTATYLSLAYPKWYIIVPAFTWAGAVGYSRMYLGVHYPSDVLAGAALGAGTAYLTYYLNKKYIARNKLHHRTVQPLGWMN